MMNYKNDEKLECVVSFENKEVKDSKKQTLYVFVSLCAKVTGADYTDK